MISKDFTPRFKIFNVVTKTVNYSLLRDLQNSNTEDAEEKATTFDSLMVQATSFREVLDIIELMVNSIKSPTFYPKQIVSISEVIEHINITYDQYLKQIEVRNIESHTLGTAKPSITEDKGLTPGGVYPMERFNKLNNPEGLANINQKENV